MVTVSRTPAASLDTRRSVAAAIAEAWRPRRRWRTADWVEKYFRVALDESGARHVRFSFVEYPFTRGIFDAFDDPRVERISWRKATRTGGTTVSHALLASRPIVDPCPIGWFGPNRDYVREKRKLFDACAENTEGLRERLQPPNLRNDRVIHLRECVCYLGWSGSPQTFGGRTCRVVLRSEVDRWRRSPKEGSTVKLVEERVKSFPFSFKIFSESTATDETSEIEALYEDGDQRTWQVPCPHCGHFQMLRFWVHRDGPFVGCGGLAGIRDKHGNAVAPEEARRHAYYLCEKGCRITDADKPSMGALGEWVPRGQALSPTGELLGEPQKATRHASFYNSSLDTTSISFGRAAEEMLRAERDGTLREFWNNWVGMVYRSRGRVPRWQALGRRLASPTYRRGQVPPWVYFLTAGVDVQLNRAYYVVRGWGINKTSALITWGMVKRTGETDAEADDPAVLSTELASDLAELDRRLLGERAENGRVIAALWPVLGENPWGQTELPIAKMGADSQWRTGAVHSWARFPARHDVLLLTAGVPALDRRGEWYRPNTIERNTRTGKPYPGGLTRWELGTHAYKEDIQSRWDLRADAPGAWLLPADIMQRGDDYLKQVTNERMIVDAVKKKRTWQVISDSLGNHYFDGEVIASAMADMAVGQDWSQDSLQRLAAAGQRAPPREPAAAAPQTIVSRVDDDAGFSAR